MYTQLKVHVPEKYHEQIKSAVTQGHRVAVKIDLSRDDGEQIILLTPGQLLKIQRAKFHGKKYTTVRMSKRQARANMKFEGGFLSVLLNLASKVLPTLLGGLATGLISGGVEKAISGNGLRIGKRGYGTARIDVIEGGNGLKLTPVEPENHDGLYYKHNGQIYQGEGLLFGANSPFKNIPILNLLL